MIKPVEKADIPQNNSDKGNSVRAMIQADIEETLEKRIPAFEFEGDYNYKYLGNYAREVARNMWCRETLDCRREARKKARERGLKWIPISDFKHQDMWIKITTRKGEDHRRVFCEIDFDFLDKYPEMVDKEIEIALERQKKNDEARKKLKADSDEYKEQKSKLDEKLQSSQETSTNSKEHSTNDTISRADTIKAMCQECKGFPDDEVMIGR